MEGNFLLNRCFFNLTLQLAFDFGTCTSLAHGGQRLFLLHLFDWKTQYRKQKNMKRSMQQNHRKWSSDFATAFFTTFSPCCPKWFNHMQFFKALSTWVQKDHLITMVVFWPTWLVFLAYDWTFLDQRSFRSGFYVLLEFMIWLRFQHQAGICFHRLRARHPNLVEPHKRQGGWISSKILLSFGDLWYHFPIICCITSPSSTISRTSYHNNYIADFRPYEECSSLWKDLFPSRPFCHSDKVPVLIMSNVSFSLIKFVSVTPKFCIAFNAKNNIYFFFSVALSF